MGFLVYLWKKELRVLVIMIAVTIGISIPVLAVIRAIPNQWLELGRALCFTGCLFGVPIIAVLSVVGWIRGQWQAYQQYKRWQAGDHSA